MTDQQQPEQKGQRAHYSTGGRAGAAHPASRPDEWSNSTLGLSINQWTAVACLGVVLFIGLALVFGVLVGRALHGPLTARASTVVLPARSAPAIPVQPVGTRPDGRMDPRAAARGTGVSRLFDQVLAAGDEAPGFKLQALGGGTLSLGDLRGRTILVNFWATWCTWCKYELPALQAVYEKYQDAGLVVVGVDVEEPQGLVEAYVQRYGLSFPVVLDEEGRTAEAYRVRGLPMTYFVNRKGVIVHVKRGAMREDELELYVRNALAAD
jgi:peroxiredoxin